MTNFRFEEFISGRPYREEPLPFFLQVYTLLEQHPLLSTVESRQFDLEAILYEQLLQ